MINPQFLCIHDDINNLIESALDSKLLLINSNSQHLEKKEQEVKNVVEQPAEHVNRSIQSLQNFRVVHKSYISFKDTYQISSIHSVAPIQSTKEPEHLLSMGYEHLSITPETESDKVTESNAENFLSIPSKYEDNDDLKSSDDESLPDEDVPAEEFKINSNPLCDKDEINSDKLDPHCFNVESDFVESLLNRDTFIDFSSKFDFSGELASIKPEILKSDFDFEEEIRLIENLLYDNSFPRPPEDLNAKIAGTIIETIPLLPIPVQDGNSQQGEIDIVTETDDVLPPSVENDDDLLNDSLLEEGDLFLVSDDSIPSEPPNDDFDLEPEVISAVMKDIDEPDEHFNPGGEIFVSKNNEDVDYFPFMFVIRIFLPYLILPEISPLLLSAESEDTIFDPEGIIADLDAYTDVTLEEVEVEKTAKVEKNADFQGRQEESQAKAYHIDLEHVDKVLISAANTTITAAAPITAATIIVAPSAARRRKGVVIKDPEETATPSTIIHTESKSKDKGKRIMVQEPKPLKKQAHIEQDEAYARELKAELNKNINWDDTEAQAKKNMMVYLKNMAGFKMDYFKGMRYDDIRPIFEKYFNFNKLDEEVEELKKHLQIVLDDDDVYTEATSLALKVPVVDYEIYSENNKPFYKIIRADGSHQLFLSFLSLLRNFDREDLEMLWPIVKEIFASSKLKNFSDDFLLTTLTYMFEKPDVEAQVWKNQRSVHSLAKVKSWRLLESYGVHIITFTTTQMILLVERRYPLTRFTLEQMLNNVRLEVEEESEVSLELLRFAEAVNTACYVQNRVLVTKAHNKTLYELLISRAPIISFMRPFGCLVTILNTLDHLRKFNGKADEGFLVGYSINSKEFRVYNSITKKVEENLHGNFLENKPNVVGSGLKIHSDEGQEGKEKVSDQEYILLPVLNTSSDVPSSNEEVVSSPKDNVDKKTYGEWNFSTPINAVDSSFSHPGAFDDFSKMPNLEDTGIFDGAYDDRDEGAEADYNNLETIEPKKVTQALDDESWVEAMQEELLKLSC
nr:retrovirus-related Pol polyprotein from transposon TNT 1-94 [Tanacetum cinerariifolium]